MLAWPFILFSFTGPSEFDAIDPKIKVVTRFFTPWSNRVDFKHGIDFEQPWPGAWQYTKMPSVC